MTRPSDRKVVSRGVEMLRGGVPASNLPNQLMAEFGISSERAQELARRAVVVHKKTGKLGRLDKKPFDGPA